MVNTLADVENNNLFNLISQLESALEEIDPGDKPKNTETVDRFVALCKLMIANVNKSDKILIPTFALNEAAAQVQNTINEINNFNANKNLPHITNAINHISNALKSYPFPFNIRSDEEGEGVLSQTVRFSERVVEKLDSNAKSLQNELSALKNNTNSLKQEIQAERERITQGLGSVETQYTEAQAARQSAFESALNEHQDQFDKHLSDTDASLDKFLQENKGRFENESSEILESIEKLKADMEGKRKEILEIYKIVGRDAQIGGYEKTASDARTAAGIWDVLVFLFGIFAISVLIGPSLYLFFQNPSASIDWTQVLSRIPISTVLFFPAGYAIAQARREKKIADSAKEMSLQMAALGPYLSSLPHDLQQKMRALLTQRFFSGGADAPIDLRQVFNESEEDA